MEIVNATGEGYPAWLWKLVGDFDRWAHHRLPEVQRLIVQAVDGVKIEHARILTLEEVMGLYRDLHEAERELEEARRKCGPPSDSETEDEARARQGEEERESNRLLQLRARLFPAVGPAEVRRFAQKVAFLARVHDVMIEQEPGRRYRQGWTPITPELDGLQSVAFALEFDLSDLPSHEKDRRDGLETEIECCWREVQEATATLGQDSSAANSDPVEPMGEASSASGAAPEAPAKREGRMPVKTRAATVAAPEVPPASELPLLASLVHQDESAEGEILEPIEVPVSVTREGALVLAGKTVTIDRGEKQPTTVELRTRLGDAIAREAGHSAPNEPPGSSDFKKLRASLHGPLGSLGLTVEHRLDGGLTFLERATRLPARLLWRG